MVGAICNRDVVIATLVGAICNRDVVIATLVGAICNRDVVIATLVGAICNRDVVIATLVGAICNREHGDKTYVKPEEIYEALTAQFGEAVLGFDTELAGDPSISVAPSAIAKVCQYLAETDTLAFDSLMCLSGADLSAKDEELVVVYHIYAMQHRHSVVLKTAVPKTDPHLPSVSHIWKTADWHEREAYDLYGILFEGHSDLRRILLPDDWDGYPLRKDYKEPEFYRGMRVPY